MRRLPLNDQQASFSFGSRRPHPETRCAGRARCGYRPCYTHSCRLCHPRLQVLNSLLYWLLDLTYKEMGVGLSIPRWAPEPYLLRVPGVEARMVAELCKLGHLLDVLARAPAADDAEAVLEGPELLRAVRETETTATLLSTIGRACEERGEVEADAPPPRVVARYAQLVASPGLELIELQALQHEALAELLDLEVGLVAARHAAIAEAFGEWHRPELLFRYLDDNRGDAKNAALITRWLRSIFGLSDESQRQIRREAHANVRHLSALPQGVMLRWYAEACPGTSSMQVRPVLTHAPCTPYTPYTPQHRCALPSHTHPAHAPYTPQHRCASRPHISHLTYMSRITYTAPGCASRWARASTCNPIASSCNPVQPRCSFRWARTLAPACASSATTATVTTVLWWGWCCRVTRAPCW